MQRALASLDRRLGASWERSGLAKAKSTPACIVRADRLEVNASEIAKEQILDIPGFRSKGDHFLRRKNPKTFLPYRRVANYESKTSIRQLDVLYEPSGQWIAPLKVTLIPCDETGLLPGDVLSVLELLTGATIVRLEIAFDFAYQSGIDGEWARSYSLFGKAQRNQVGTLRGYDCWGSRKGAKLVRSYYKEELHVHRVELQLNRKFLHRYGIDDIFDFHRLTSVLPMNHIWFAEIDAEKMRHHLRMAGHWGREYRQILERVADGSGDLIAQCSVLRKRGRLKNVRRALIPRTENELVRDALKKWATQWPRVANRLEAK